MVKDHDCGILYRAEKANVVANALIHKVLGALIRDICLRIVVTLPLLDLIKKA